jgi:RNA polymerase sigma-70 factor, ECF subfamily
MFDASKSDASISEDTDQILDHIPALRAYARGLTRQSNDADDLLQETLAKAIANISKFQPGTNMRAWMFTIMRNSFLTDVRKRTREHPGAEDCVSILPVTYPSHEAYITGQRLFQAIARLPPHYRDILHSVVVIGESYEATALKAGCALGTVKSRVNRARRMVMEDLGTTDIRDVLEMTPNG